MIFISAGHYPSDPGAKFERFIEHDEAVIWRDLLCELLGDECLSVPTGFLKTKVAFINARVMNGDIAIEIHFNAALDGKGHHVGRGCESLYYPGSVNGKALALRCQAALSETYPPDRGAKEGWYRMDRSRGADFFLVKTKCVAVIIEPEFVHRFEIIVNNREQAIANLAETLKGLET